MSEIVVSDCDLQFLKSSYIVASISVDFISSKFDHAKSYVSQSAFLLENHLVTFAWLRNKTSKISHQ